MAFAKRIGILPVSFKVNMNMIVMNEMILTENQINIFMTERGQII